MRQALILGLISVTFVAAYSPQAEACGPGKQNRSYLVAGGTSLHGVPWRISARRITVAGVGAASSSLTRGANDEIEIHFVTVGYPESGFGAVLPLKIPHSFLFTAIGGSYVDPPPEVDLSGIAAKRVLSLVVRFQAGDTATVYPQLAPSKLRRNICWTRRLRYFDTYFEGNPVPIEVSALDAAGRTLVTKKPTGGSFF
jgi:hypothetical protein